MKSDTQNEKLSIMKVAIPLADGKLAMHFGHCEKFAILEVDENQKKITNQQVIPAPEHQPGLLPRWLHEQGAFDKPENEELKSCFKKLGLLTV